MYELLLRKEDICLNLLKYIFKQCAQTIACYIPYIQRHFYNVELRITSIKSHIYATVQARIPTFISIEKYTLAAFS